MKAAKDPEAFFFLPDSLTQPKNTEGLLCTGLGTEELGPIL